MKRNILGKTGFEVSELSFGTLIISKLQLDFPVPEGARAVAKGFEMGINLFDTAASYGTEKHLREGLKGVIDQVYIATKTHAHTREKAQNDFETSLRDLGRDYVDIYFLHLVKGEEDLRARSGTLEYIIEMKEQGRIRAIGISVHQVAGARAAISAPWVDVLFPILNKPGIGIVDGNLEDIVAICKEGKAAGIGIMAMKPLAGGQLCNSAREALEFVRDLGVADTICVGMRSPAEVEANVRFMEGRSLPPEVAAQIDTTSRRLKIIPRCIGCGACVKACAQKALSLDYSQADPSTGKKAQSVVDQSRCVLCGYCFEVCPEFVLRVV